LTTPRAAVAILSGLIMAFELAGQPQRLTFEVISIKPSNPAATEGGGVGTLPGGQEYRAAGAPLDTMARVIYRLLIPQIRGGPEWIKSDRWDVDAKADHGGYNLDQLHEMFKNLFADRFRLKFHWETKDGPIYALTVAESGLKMKPTQTPEPLKVLSAAMPSAPAGWLATAFRWNTWRGGWDSGCNRTDVLWSMTQGSLDITISDFPICLTYPRTSPASVCRRMPRTARISSTR
jgi:hypothetical protein